MFPILELNFEFVILDMVEYILYIEKWHPDIISFTTFFNSGIFDDSGE